MTFSVTATDGAARAGVLRTAHGDVPTPAFMPVGTKATVKTLDPGEVRAIGAHIVLGNTYHLYFRPGHELIAELGGLHRFMGWDGPILTDSGGYQVFSLRDTIAAVDDEGVTFRSVYDGAAARFTPELAAEIQAALGSDIAMCFDQVLPPDLPRARARASGPANDALGGETEAGARARPASCCSESPRVGSTRGCDGNRSRRSPPSTSTATRSAASRSARAASRCSS